MERDLEGKSAVVTGSGRNIGRAIALEFAARGANVVVNARSNAEEASAVAEEARAFGVKAIVVVGDMSEQDTVDEIANRGAEHFGHIDISVSNAATRPYQSFLDTPLEDWLHILDVQLNASFRLAKAFVPGMIEQGWGRIIHITGPDAFYGSLNRAHNVAAKGGLRGLTKALARELGQYGITVNDVAPGFIEKEGPDTGHPVISAVAREEDDRGAAYRKRMVAESPLRRYGKPEDIAYACGFLASPRGNFVTGAVIPCFGGVWMVP